MATDLADRAEKNIWKVAGTYGLGVVVLVILAGVMGWTLERQASFIREQLLGVNERQATVISQNSEQLRANAELMKAQQQCMENCSRAYADCTRIMDRVIERLDKP